LRCYHDLRNASYDNIDSLYTARHEYARNKIIDALLARFGDWLLVKSEHSISTGKLDIALLPPLNIIVLKYDRIVVGIEIKSGSWVGATTFNQIERYLFDVDYLLIVRIPTKDVVLIDRSLVESTLSKDLMYLEQKIERIMSGKLPVVQGPWCAGCRAECEFKKPSKWNTNRPPSFEGYEKFVTSLDSVIEKIIAILEKEFDRHGIPFERGDSRSRSIANNGNPVNSDEVVDGGKGKANHTLDVDLKI
jgi:hypothetical protein